MSSSMEGVLSVVVGLGVVVVVVVVVSRTVVVGTRLLLPLDMDFPSRPASMFLLVVISFKLFSTARAMMRLANAVSGSSMLFVVRTDFWKILKWLN